MKNNPLLLLLLALLIVSCKKDGLTKENQSGANTFSCKINGSVFLPGDAPGFGGGAPLFRSYNESTKDLMVYAKNTKSKPYKQIILNIHGYNGPGIYYIDNVDIYAKYNEYYFDKEFESQNGNIKITKDDRLNRILSGTFEFNARIISNETVNITSGRFDIGY